SGTSSRHDPSPTAGCKRPLTTSPPGIRLLLFFFKQKTAYEIGLGIPAEPLFRSSVNSRERSGINTILHELNPLFTINVTMRDIKSKNVYSRVNSKATTQWRKTESANGVHLEGVASDNRSS